MPQSYGARREGIHRIALHQRRAFPARNVILEVCRIELGPTRRDPQGHLPPPNDDANDANGRARINTRPSHVDRSEPLGCQQRTHKTALQGASATGGSTVTRCARPEAARVTAERQPSGVMPWSTTFEFGVSVLARMAHVNRACTWSVFNGRAYAHNHRREHHSNVMARRCTLQNGLPAKSSAAHGVHG